MATLTKSCQLVTNVVDKALAASDLKESGLYPSPSFQSTNRQPTFPSGQETSRTCTKDFLAPSTTRMTLDEENRLQLHEASSANAK